MEEDGTWNFPGNEDVIISWASVSGTYPLIHESENKTISRFYDFSVYSLG